MEFIQKQTEPPVEERKIKAKGLNILVVDDMEDICSLLKMFLVNDGHTVKTAEGGKRAIEMLKAETFDVVLTDITMPDVSGYEVIAVLKRLEKRPKIGLMTGWSEDIETKDKNELDVDFILRKPFNFSELSKYMNEAFNADNR